MTQASLVIADSVFYPIADLGNSSRTRAWEKTIRTNSSFIMLCPVSFVNDIEVIRGIISPHYQAASLAFI